MQGNTTQNAKQSEESIWRIEDGVTSSILNEHLKCSWKLYWGTILGYAPTEVKAKSVRVGWLVHDLIRRVHLEQPIQTSPSSEEEAIALAMVECYQAYRNNLPYAEVEREFCVYDEELRVFWRGRWDAITETGYVVDIKTRTRDIPDLDALAHSPQTLIYLRARKLTASCQGMTYVYLRRPLIRRRQRETLEEFYERCKMEVFGDASFLCVVNLYLSEAAIVQRLKSYLGALREDYSRFRQYLAGDSTDIPRKNHHWCCTVWGDCPYLELCMRGNLTGLQRVGPFRELDLTEE